MIRSKVRDAPVKIESIDLTSDSLLATRIRQSQLLPCTPTPRQNRLLAALSDEARNRLIPHLELVSLSLGDVVRHIYFPTDCIVSLLSVMGNGASAEISVVGNEGLVGVALNLGGESTPGRAVVQSAGSAYRLPRPRLKDEFNRHGEFLMLMLRYARCLTTQMAQTALCNRAHSLDQQLCRWLLLSMDRLPTNALTITPELIGNMLGVCRDGVTKAADKLQKLAVIQYSGGRITVVNRPKLEMLSCECYAVIRGEIERVFPSATPMLALINERSAVRAASMSGLTLSPVSLVDGRSQCRRHGDRAGRRRCTGSR
jgi:CRP-like cAMP-binding protein